MTGRSASEDPPRVLVEAAAAGSLAETPEAESLSIGEMLRIMDVASTLRRERELVEREFSADEVRAGLREKLRSVAETTGETISEEEIEAAIEWYYRNLHVYREPPWSLSLFVAHAWVRRGAILGWTTLVVAVGLLVWWWRR